MVSRRKGNSFYWTDVTEDVRLLVIPELSPEAFKPKTKAAFKSFTGRDKISATKKHENGLKVTSFHGIVVMVSNYTPEQLLGTDRSMWSRCIPIRMIPPQGKPDVNLIKYFQSHAVEFITWVSSMPQNQLELYARTDPFVSTDMSRHDSVALFCKIRFVYGKEERASFEKVLNAFVRFEHGDGVDKKSTEYTRAKTTLRSSVLEFLKTQPEGAEVQCKRLWEKERRLFFFQGLRLTSEEESEQNFRAHEEELREQDGRIILDPFCVDHNFPLNESKEEWGKRAHAGRVVWDPTSRDRRVYPETIIEVQSACGGKEFIPYSSPAPGGTGNQVSPRRRNER